MLNKQPNNLQDIFLNDARKNKIPVIYIFNKWISIKRIM